MCRLFAYFIAFLCFTPILDIFSQETGTLVDIEGKQYNTVKIGEQWWMAENLASTRYSDGTLIPLVSDNDVWKELGNNNIDKAYSYYNNSESNGYGALYTWAAAMNGSSASTGIPSGIQGVCPSNWHIPSDAEWDELINFVGSEGFIRNEGKALKAIANWASNGNGTDNFAFAALPGGNRWSSDGSFNGGSRGGFWWSSTETSASYAYLIQMYYQNSEARTIQQGKSTGMSVRCIKDTEGEQVIISKQPKDAQGILLGKSFQLSLEVIANDPVFQWKKNGINLSNNERVSGASTSVLSVSNSNLSDAGEYTCNVSNTNANTTSEVAIIIISDIETGTIEDIEGNLYSTVKIGQQWWMAENLAVTKLNDDIPISMEEDATLWKNMEIPGYCWYDNNEANNIESYGALYNWYTVNTQQLCPTDWHIPTHGEWNELINFVKSNGYFYEAIGLKSNEGWPINENGIDEFGFSGRPSGQRYNGSFSGQGQGAQYAIGNQEGGSSINTYALGGSNNHLNTNFYSKDFGHSVRCIKEVPEEIIIITQPLSVNTIEGNNVELIIEVSGSDPFFQWQKNGADIIDNERISGTNASTLIINETKLSDEGVYTCIVSNSINQIKSEGASISITPFIEITSYNISREHPELIDEMVSPGEIVELEFILKNNSGYSPNFVEVDWAVIEESIHIEQIKSFKVGQLFESVKHSVTFKLSNWPSNNELTLKFSYTQDNGKVYSQDIVLPINQHEDLPRYSISELQSKIRNKEIKVGERFITSYFPFVRTDNIENYDALSSMSFIANLTYGILHAVTSVVNDIVMDEIKTKSLDFLLSPLTNEEEKNRYLMFVASSEASADENIFGNMFITNQPDEVSDFWSTPGISNPSKVIATLKDYRDVVTPDSPGSDFEIDLPLLEPLCYVDDPGLSTDQINLFNNIFKNNLETEGYLYGVVNQTYKSESGEKYYSIIFSKDDPYSSPILQSVINTICSNQVIRFLIKSEDDKLPDVGSVVKVEGIQHKADSPFRLPKTLTGTWRNWYYITPSKITLLAGKYINPIGLSMEFIETDILNAPIISELRKNISVAEKKAFFSTLSSTGECYSLNFYDSLGNHTGPIFDSLDMYVGFEHEIPNTFYYSQQDREILIFYKPNEFKGLTFEINECCDPYSLLVHSSLVKDSTLIITEVNELSEGYNSQSIGKMNLTFIDSVGLTTSRDDVQVDFDQSLWSKHWINDDLSKVGMSLFIENNQANYSEINDVKVNGSSSLEFYNEETNKIMLGVNELISNAVVTSNGKYLTAIEIESNSKDFYTTSFIADTGTYLYASKNNIQLNEDNSFADDLKISSNLSWSIIDIPEAILVSKEESYFSDTIIISRNSEYSNTAQSSELRINYANNILIIPVAIDKAVNASSVVINNNEVFVIYPNPAKNYFVIEINRPGYYTLNVFSSLGKKVLSRKIDSNSRWVEIDSSGLPEGVYHILLQGEKITRTFRIVIT